MEKIRIKGKNFDIILYLDKKKYWGYKFYKDGKIEKIDSSVFKYFDFLTLSDNYIEVESHNEYKTYLDKNTKFLHFFKDGKENYEMFFNLNGEDSIRYKGKGFFKKDDCEKIFRKEPLSAREIIFAFSMSALLLTLPFLGPNKAIDPVIQTADVIVSAVKKIDFSYQDHKIIASVENIELFDLKEMIYASPYLDESEKSYLFNSAFLRNVLEIINESEFQKLRFYAIFDNLNIRSYGNENAHYDAKGYYSTKDANTLFIRDYEKINYENMDIISHEFVHLCQDNTGYNFFLESTAEIISDEYFNCAPVNGYKPQVKLVKKLMEIIGPEPVFKYVFGGDFTLIEEKVRPYLTEAEYQEFINDLTFDTFNPSANVSKNESLEKIIGILYQKKYNADIKDDIIINLIDNDDYSLCRYYFSDLFVNGRPSYYLEANPIESSNVNITKIEKNEEGFDINYEIEIDYEKFKNDGIEISTGELSDNESFRTIPHQLSSQDIFARISFLVDADISETFFDKNTCTRYITGYLNGEYYEKVDAKILEEKGYLVCKYFAEINYRTKTKTPADIYVEIVDSDSEPQHILEINKIELPTIDERNQTTKQKSK